MKLSWRWVIFYFILGMIFWTFSEYMLHRFLGHVPKSPFNRTRFHKEHTKHHFIRDYFALNIDKLLTCIAFGPVVFFISYFLVSKEFATFFTIGFLVMYFVYELIHRNLHVRKPTHRYAAFMRVHHFYHHFGDEQMNHGVTSPVWDVVFGTYVKVNLITVPKKYELRWFKNNDSSNVFSDGFGHSYQIN